MKCEVCGQEFPSTFYFAAPTVCRECFRKQHPDAPPAPTEEVAPREIAGHSLVCPHCRHDRFRLRATLMNTRGMTFLGLDWANKEADNYVCARCGFVVWFLSE